MPSPNIQEITKLPGSLSFFNSFLSKIAEQLPLRVTVSTSSSFLLKVSKFFKNFAYFNIWDRASTIGILMWNCLKISMNFLNYASSLPAFNLEGHRFRALLHLSNHSPQWVSLKHYGLSLRLPSLSRHLDPELSLTQQSCRYGVILAWSAPLVSFSAAQEATLRSLSIGPCQLPNLVLQVVNRHLDVPQRSTKLVHLSIDTYHVLGQHIFCRELPLWLLLILVYLLLARPLLLTLTLGKVRLTPSYVVGIVVWVTLISLISSNKVDLLHRSNS